MEASAIPLLCFPWGSWELLPAPSGSLRISESGLEVVSTLHGEHSPCMCKALESTPELFSLSLDPNVGFSALTVGD